MKNDNLKAALQNVMKSDIERYETAAEYEFSPKFVRNMKRLTKMSSGKKHIRLGVRMAAAVVAAAATFAVGTFAGAVSSGFSITKSNKYYYNGFPANVVTYTDTEGCPETLETVYTIGKLPDKIALRTVSLNEDNKTISTVFMPDVYDDSKLYDEIWAYRHINLVQSTKDQFESSFSAANYVSHKEIEFNGKRAYFITREHFFGQESSLIWDGGDYIFELLGYFTEEHAVELAKSLVPFDGELRDREIVEV